MAASMSPMLFCSRELFKRISLEKRFLRRIAQANCATKENPNYWRPVIGLEIHAQILSNSKLFSGAGTKFAAATNSQVSHFDTALPGTLPVINKRCVEAAVKTGLALNCKVNLVSKFDRKHYFYADLPAGYQITQHRIPIAVDGHLDYIVYGKHTRLKPKHYKAKIIQIQIEQDSGKSLHDVEYGKSLIDLNRAGMGLMEIVTAPDFTSSEEASSFVNELQLVLRTIGTCDGIMAEGSLRVDANISVHAPGEPLKGIRAEVKNINSFRFVRKAIDYEIERQIKIRESGQNITRETRSFDFATGTTIAMRDKESLTDYRFMPEPNLPPLRLCDNSCPDENRINVDHMKALLPRLPTEMRHDLEHNYAVPAEHAFDIVKDGLYEYSLDVFSKAGVDPAVAASSVLAQLIMWLREHKKHITECCVTVEQLADLSIVQQNHRVSDHVMQGVLRSNYDGDARLPSRIIDENDWWIIDDRTVLVEICKQLMEENPSTVAKYRKGKKRIINFFIGGVHKATDRRADVKLVEEVVTQTLKE